MVGIYAAIVCDVLFTFICGVDGVHLQICYFSTYLGCIKAMAKYEN